MYNLLKPKLARIVLAKLYSGKLGVESTETC